MAEVRLFINHGTFKIWSDGLAYPGPWDRAFNVTGDGELAILNALKAQDLDFSVEERSKIKDYLRAVGFTELAWDRMRDNRWHRAGPFAL